MEIIKIEFDCTKIRNIEKKLNRFVKKIKLFCSIDLKRHIHINCLDRATFQKKLKNNQSFASAFCENGDINIIKFEELTMSKKDYEKLIKHEIIHAILFDINKKHTELF